MHETGHGRGRRHGSTVRTRAPQTRWRWVALAAATALLARPTASAAQRLPYEFDPELAERPDEVRSMMAADAAGLPDLPLDRMTGIELAGPVRLRLFHEAASFLDGLVHAERLDYAWPRDAEGCAAHDAFTLPTELLRDSSAECRSAHDGVAVALSALDACGDAAEPERYVLEYPPGVVNDGNTDEVLELIGVIGSTLAEFPPLYDGVLPPDFVPRLRDILRKLRHETLLPRLRGQLDAFHDALTLLDVHDECFVPEAGTRLAADVANLVSEATAQLERLERLQRDGELEQRREALRLGAVSRSRHELPYPSLTQPDREFLAFWLGGLYWRLRGGGFVDLGGTQTARRLGLRRPYNALGELAGLGHGTEAADGVYCEIFEGWGEWFDMGTTPGQEDKYYDLVRMTRRGYEQIRTAVHGSTALNPCTIPDYPFLLSIEGLNRKGYDTTSLHAGGLSMGPCYYFAWDRLLGWTWATDVTAPYTQAIDGPTALGEVCTGGSIALGLVRTLLLGWATDPPPYAGLDAVFLAQPDGESTPACAARGGFARVTVIPLDDVGGPLPPGQDVTVVEDPPSVVGGAVESFTDPVTGVTEYTLEVGSDRCSPETPYDVGVRVGGVVLRETVPLRFTCPPVAEDGVGFRADPAEVAADGRSFAAIRVDARDICGNPAFGRAVALQVEGAAPAALSVTETTTGDEPGGPFDGAATAEARSLVAGTMGLAATIDGTVFHSAPDLVTFRTAMPVDGGDVGSDDADGSTADGDDAAPAHSRSEGCSCAVPSGDRGPRFWSLLLGLAALRRRRR